MPTLRSPCASRRREVRALDTRPPHRGTRHGARCLAHTRHTLSGRADSATRCHQSPHTHRHTHSLTHTKEKSEMAPLTTTYTRRSTTPRLSHTHTRGTRGGGTHGRRTAARPAILCTAERPDARSPLCRIAVWINGSHSRDNEPPPPPHTRLCVISTTHASLCTWRSRHSSLTTWRSRHSSLATWRSRRHSSLATWRSRRHLRFRAKTCM